MKPSMQHTIYTIGHSTHPLGVFIKMLESFNIGLLADIRRFPGSRKYPQFNREPLAAALQQAGIRYVHIEDLGGRRKARPGSENSRWRNEAFRGYADYMETDAFKIAMDALEVRALEQPTVYMCAEAVWWRCHRALVSDYLKAKGWTVLHIMGVGKAEEHPYTAPARIYDGRVFYADENLFDAK
ncbi:DUF488 domain-containing protein [Niabella drilacis]|uniref:Fe-S cluster assembly protein HesB n=1 Tax=Niabella drilacis (strain DSM 25811 / CCM 8410 / CCUG 62505 / LMG 26954 / E90) TaxID=1285928 RepID=A0A1G6IWX0_NIADE|nr:DUF488 domain-containing protein [Niabella drilacis]SDC11072.1 Protein of unknown function, DUF488 [Niabella drilacis]